MPSPAAAIEGCRFKGRCWLREQLGDPDECDTVKPELQQVKPGHGVACHFSDRIDPDRVAAASKEIALPTGAE